MESFNFNFNDLDLAIQNIVNDARKYQIQCKSLMEKIEDNIITLPPFIIEKNLTILNKLERFIDIDYKIFYCKTRECLSNIISQRKQPIHISCFEDNLDNIIKNKKINIDYYLESIKLFINTNDTLEYKNIIRNWLVKTIHIPKTVPLGTKSLNQRKSNFLLKLDTILAYEEPKKIDKIETDNTLIRIGVEEFKYSPTLSSWTIEQFYETIKRYDTKLIKYVYWFYFKHTGKIYLHLTPEEKREIINLYDKYNYIFDIKFKHLKYPHPNKIISAFLLYKGKKEVYQYTIKDIKNNINTDKVIKDTFKEMGWNLD